MSLMQVFRGTMRSFKHILKDGAEAIFRPDPFSDNGSVFYTDNEDHVKELEAEIKARHPMIWRDPERMTIDSSQTSPEAALRAQIREEILREQANVALRQAPNLIPRQAVTGHTAPAPMLVPASTVDMTPQFPGIQSQGFNPVVGVPQFAEDVNQLEPSAQEQADGTLAPLVNEDQVPTENKSTEEQQAEQEKVVASTPVAAKLLSNLNTKK